VEGLLSLDGMKERMAACLAHEEQVVRQGVRSEALRALHYLFAAQAKMDRADFKAMPGLGDRLATAQVSALPKRGLLATGDQLSDQSCKTPQHRHRNP
jgi:hypothetical protein